MTTASTTLTQTRTYTIDQAHSDVVFQVRHLLSKVRGRFSDFSGTIDFNADAPEQSSVAFTIRTASIDTNQPDRDAHLRSTDFFSADQFPTLTFTSSRLRALGDGQFDVEGNLAIRGVTRSVVLPVTYLGVAKDPWGNEKLAFETEITINRRDFGLTWNAVLETGGFIVGDEVFVNVSVQAQAK